MAQQIVLEVEVDEKGAITSIKKIEDEVENLGKAAKKTGKDTQESFGWLEKTFPRLSGGLKGVKSGITSLASGFKTLRAAIISTGVGALVVALTALVTYFTKTKRGAELLERATAGLGAVFNTIVDKVLVPFGETLSQIFTEPQKALETFGDSLKTVGGFLFDIGTIIGATVYKRIKQIQQGLLSAAIAAKSFFGSDTTELNKSLDQVKREIAQIDAVQQEAINGVKTTVKSVVDSVKDLASEIADNVSKTDQLTKASQRLRDVERELSVERAKRRADIKEFNKIAEDTTKTYQERIRAAEQAGAIEQELLQKRLNAAAEQVRIIKTQNSLSESTEEDLQRLADAEIELANVREESYELQTTLQNKYNTLKDQERQETLRAEKALAEEQKKILEEVNKVREFLDSKRIQSEEEKINERYAILREQANGETELLKELEFQRQAELLAVKQEGLLAEEKAEKESAARQEAAEKELNARKVEYAQSTASALVGIATALAGDSEANAKKIFAVNKALGIATATADTFRAANAVLADPTLVGFTRFAAVASVITTGLANVAKIAASKFQGGATSGGGGSRPSFSSGATAQAPQPTAAIDLGFLNQQTQNAIPAYVVATQVTGQQEANTRVKDLATL